jgi:hypothetical protein
MLEGQARDSSPLRASAIAPIFPPGLLASSSSFSRLDPLAASLASAASMGNPSPPMAPCPPMGMLARGGPGGTPSSRYAVDSPRASLHVIRPTSPRPYQPPAGSQVGRLGPAATPPHRTPRPPCPEPVCPPSGSTPHARAQPPSTPGHVETATLKQPCMRARPLPPTPGRICSQPPLPTRICSRPPPLPPQDLLPPADVDAAYAEAMHGPRNDMHLLRLLQVR